MRFLSKAGFVSLMAAFVMCATPCMSEAVQLTYASNGPENTIRGVAEKIFLDELVIQSKGKIKVTPFWSSTLLSASESLKGVQDGVVDMAFMNPDFFPKALPFWCALALPVYGPTKGAELNALYAELYEKIPAFKQEFTKFKQFPVYFFWSDSTSFTSRKPLNSVEQLKGVKARSASRWMLEHLNALGATPVSVSWGDCYMALQTGTIETVVTSVESQHRGKLYEVGPYLWVWEKMWMGTPLLITMNEKKFKKLDKELQDAIIRAGKVASEKFAQKFDNDMKDEIEAMAKAGAKVTYADDTAYAAWQSLPTCEGNIQTWLKEAKEDGVTDADKIFAEIRSIVEKYVKK